MKKVTAIMCLLLLAVGTVWGQANIVPETDSTKTLGTASLRWLALYALDSRAVGGEGTNAFLYLDADDGDDDPDTWILESEAADNDFTINNHTTEIIQLTQEGMFSLWGATGAVGVAIYGFEATDAFLQLNADQGDDSNDTWYIESEAADNDLSIVKSTTEIAKFGTNGALYVWGNSADGLLQVYGHEGCSASLYLNADQGDEPADDWILRSFATGNALTIGNSATGAVISIASDGTLSVTNHVVPIVDTVSDIGTSSLQFGNGYFDEILHADALNAGYSVKSNSATLTSADMMVLYNSGGDATEDVCTNTLPEASANLGMAVWITVASDAGDLEVITDGTDSFVDAPLGAATPGSNLVTFADQGDGALFVAAGTNYWAIMFNVGGEIGAQ